MKKNISNIKTLKALKESGYTSRSVKEEIRSNIIPYIKDKRPLFENIIGFEDSVIPEITNAILSRHNFILLGLRGQAKSKIFRQLTLFLDEYIPVIKDSPLNEDPFIPITKSSREKVQKDGDTLAIQWLHRDERYQEKLATPDVNMSDLIGDVDPIKAATKKLSFSDEEVIHFGIIPRTNRGIFAINELPDLPARIQVGLFNILEENDVQIRGFPVRFPLDILMVFSANPEDYTNRGSIITPLKDRIDSQILTHYPKELEQGMEITAREAWTSRKGEVDVYVPSFFSRLLELVTRSARENKDYIDQTSGVSVRMSISSMENFVSNMERRALINGESKAYPRISDLNFLVPSMTGKLELVYEGTQEGSLQVSESIIGLAVKTMFEQLFPPVDNLQGKEEEPRPENPYGPVISFFEAGNSLTIDANSDFKRYYKALKDVPGLEELAKKHFLFDNASSKMEVAAGMEFILEGLHVNSRLSKHKESGRAQYRDMISTMMDGAFNT